MSKNKVNILIIDDDENFVKKFKNQIIFKIKPEVEEELKKDIEVVVKVGYSKNEFYEKYSPEKFNIVFLDLYIEKKIDDGLELLEHIHNQKKLNVYTIMLTGQTAVEPAIRAFKLGVDEYLLKKDWENKDTKEKLKNIIKKIIDNYQFINEISETNIIGKSEAIQKVLKDVNIIKDLDKNVLITGESGVGKGVIAKAIHKKGNRSKGPFIDVNITALPKELIESELFGYEKGAFSGAIKDKKKGYFELADKGIIFLDEIGDLPLELQMKLLKVIEDKKVIPLGGEEEIKFDVRIISATNKNLEKLIEEKQFREDLYYRINVLEIKVPPLRERKEDIPLLANFFLDQFLKKENYSKKMEFSNDAMLLLIEYNWPGNIRQLDNFVQVSAINAIKDESSVIEVIHLPDKIVSKKFHTVSKKSDDFFYTITGKHSVSFTHVGNAYRYLMEWEDACKKIINRDPNKKFITKTDIANEIGKKKQYITQALHRYGKIMLDILNMKPQYFPYLIKYTNIIGNHKNRKKWDLTKLEIKDS